MGFINIIEETNYPNFSEGHKCIDLRSAADRGSMHGLFYLVASCKLLTDFPNSQFSSCYNFMSLEFLNNRFDSVTSPFNQEGSLVLHCPQNKIFNDK